jgi:hypothetical protein
MNKETLIEMSIIIIGLHAVLTENQKDVIRDQLSVLFDRAKAIGKMEEMERMIEKLNNRLEGTA